jgi:hypothetical protein
MTLTEIAPLVFALAFVGYMFAALGQGFRLSWRVPAFLSVAFFAWSVWAIVAEGPLGFWDVHAGGLWKNQVWFDLLFAVGIGWYLILPRARAEGMNLRLWVFALPLSGCIGFLAMLARLLYLEERRAKV